MKMDMIRTSVLTVTSILLITGCGRRETPAEPPEPPPARPATQAPPATASPAVEQPATSPAAVVQEAVDTGRQAVQAATEEVSRQAQELIDNARAALSERKILDATNVIEQLGALALSPEQTEAVGGLKTQVQEMAGDVIDKIGQIQAMVQDEKYQAATDLIQQALQFQLTPEQQQLVNNLKAQVQKALENNAAQEATKAIGNLIGGDKP